MDVLVLPPRYTEDSIAVAKAAGRAGWSVERLASWRVPPWLPAADCCLYAEPLFVLATCDDLGLAMIEPPYDWLPTLPSAYLQRRVWLTAMVDARRIGGRWFFKSAGEKFFPPGVFDGGDQLPRDVPENAPVLVADVVAFTAEFRFFVVGGRAVASSPYWIDGRLPRDADGRWVADADVAGEAAAFVGGFLADPAVAVPPAIVIDVGHIAGRGWAVVEANPAWGSGLYGCDPAAVLPVLRRASVPIGKLADEDRAWTFEHQHEDFS